MIDFHAGGQTAYERYVSMGADKDPNNPSDIEKKRHKLVVAFGLDIAGYFPIGIFAGTNTEDAIEEAGVVLFTPELGGGTGWYENGLDNVRVAERGIWNTMKAMRMVDGAEAIGVRNGLPIALGDVDRRDQPIRIVDPAGRLLGVYRSDGTKLLPEVVLP